MNCADARLRVGAEPRILSDELAAHLRGCEACTAFRLETLMLDDHIRRAFEIPLRAASSANTAKAARVPSWRQHWALAASVLLALAIGTLLWAVLPAPGLARQVVAHTAHEAASWESTQRLSQSAVDSVTESLGVSIDAAAHHVAYARACPFRGHTVPHLVVRTAHGPVTVLVLRDERIRSRTRFSEGGYSGILLPATVGGLAVLTREGTDVEAAARDLQNAIRPEASRR